MTRTKPREERRSELLGAARELFVEKGVVGTSMDEITRRAGVSKGLFYLYFRSKDDLIVALQEEFSRDLTVRIQSAADATADWGAKLDACVQASFDFYRDLHDLHEVLFRHGVPQNEDAGQEPALALVARGLQDLLSAGNDAGAYRVDDPAATAGLLYITMHAFDPAYHGDVDTTDTRLVRATQQLFRRAAGVG